MKIIKSLELLLYELMVWLVFYPLTLARSIIHPLKLMVYSDTEVEQAEEDRYSDTLSPPIFLAITLGLIHLVELTEGWNIQSEGFLADDKNLIAYRLVAFSLFPLMLSLRLLRSKGIALDRKTLREPFYAQCFIAAPFALGFNAGVLAIPATRTFTLGLSIMLATVIWYLAVQTAWFREERGSSRLRAFGNAARGFFEALVIVILLGVVVDAV